MENQPVEEVVEQEEVVKTYSEEELQAETDRKVTKALETSKAKWQEEFKAQLEAEKSEAAKLASLSEEERYKAELNKERETFEAERKEFKKAQLETQTLKELSVAGLPTEFATYLLAEDASTIKSNIDTFKAQWTKAIEEAVNERLNGKTPKASNKEVGSITKEQLAKMNYHERAKLVAENPELLKLLK